MSKAGLVQDTKKEIFSLDMKTPYGVALSAFYKQSFAFVTTRVQWPAIVRSIVQSLHTCREDIKRRNSLADDEEINNVVADLENFILCIESNAEIQLLQVSARDLAMWNQAILDKRVKDGHTRFYNTSWLFAECYVYRMIREIFDRQSQMRNFDPFAKQKANSYTYAMGSIISMGSYVARTVEESGACKELFVKILKLNLWSNKCDLSLTLGVTDTKVEVLDSLDKLEEFLLVDDSARIWETLNQRRGGDDVVAIVHDNTGYEIFMDFCLADCIITFNLTKTVWFYVKAMPWFISDVTAADFFWMLDALCNSDSDILKKLGNKWKEYTQNARWVVKESYFWTLPYAYKKMKKRDPGLYQELSLAKLIVFKGDLNYRKLINDVNWDPVTNFSHALGGFFPTNLCTLRTIKADCVCGLRKGVAERLDAIDDQWLVKGDYATIQYHGRF